VCELAERVSSFQLRVVRFLCLHRLLIYRSPSSFRVQRNATCG
jgi:hypothetical protein